MTARRHVARPLARLGVLVALLASCGGEDVEEPTGPRIDLIDEAVAAVEAHYGSPQEYFEVSADLDRVSIIVAVDDATAAEQGYFDDDGLLPPEPVGPADGATFFAAAIDFDADRIFDQLRDELDDPTIGDFVVQGGPNGSVIYDATVLSEAGGRILVLLGADGEVLGAQAT